MFGIDRYPVMIGRYAAGPPALPERRSSASQAACPAPAHPGRGPLGAGWGVPGVPMIASASPASPGRSDANCRVGSSGR
jgi:hypothetical protein